MKNPVLSPGLYNSLWYVGESGNSSNLLSRASSRASKQVYLRKKLQTCCIARYFSKSVSVSSTSRNVSLKALALSSPRESKEKNMGLNSKIFTILRKCLFLSSLPLFQS